MGFGDGNTTASASGRGAARREELLAVMERIIPCSSLLEVITTHNDANVGTTI
jgi:hypothetical protein